MERTATAKVSSLELAIQQSMDIDSSSSAPSSPAVPIIITNRQHTCSVLSASPNSNNGNTTEFLNEVVPKKCTCPYERPTLKTMEAAAACVAAVAAAGLAPPSSIKQQFPLSVLENTDEDDLNANVATMSSLSAPDHDQNDNINNNVSASVNLLACDSEPSRVGASIILNVNNNGSGSNSQNKTSADVEEEVYREIVDRRSNSSFSSSNTNSRAGSVKSVSEATSRTTTVVPTVMVTVGQKKNSGTCNCPEVVKVKVGEKSQSSPRSLNDGILSNCLSALNFVSGNRIGGDSKSGTSGFGGRSPRGNKSSSKTDSNSEISNKPCGENCTRSGKGSTSTPTTTTSTAAVATSAGKSAKMCKSCRGHGMSKGATSTSSSAGGSKDKDNGNGKTKRSNWALRFNYARLKGSSKSASASSSSVSPVIKEPVCKCSTASKKNVQRGVTETTAVVEAINGSVARSSCSRVGTGNNSTSASSSVDVLQNYRINGESNFGAAETELRGNPLGTSTSQGNHVAAAAQKECSRLSFIEALSTEDCDEWARMQREKEIEDGVEAPPGYLPKFQFNRIQSAVAATAANNQLPAMSPQPSLSPAATAIQNSPLSDPNRQQQQHLATANPCQSGLNSTQWPHVFCASSPELNASIQQRLLQASNNHNQAVAAAIATMANQSPQAPKVHSQVDFIHCLVPDLQKITSCGFYWGKMDRYQAETLLDGKPEGTFLLRDSAQEEYLFSVSFRKYGRSLHARIEQFNHKFSFDSHDPGVYTANTVTGLLEHYKDPSCVMFFEPMLTQPLNRNFCFSLQQLCRATIVSSTSYDSIGDLKLPQVMKGYLKEYHYKQKVRVKMFDELRTT